MVVPVVLGSGNVNADSITQFHITVNLIFLTVLYFSDLETQQNLTSINFGEQR